MSEHTEPERDSDDTRWAARVADAYRRTPPPRPEARERLDRALAREAVAVRRNPARVMRSLAALAAAVAVGFVLGRLGAPGRDPSVSAPPATDTRVAEGASVVQFVLVAPQASRVSVVGDFNGWDAQATPMDRAEGGTMWVAHVRVPAGRHVYAFVMDGERWVSDPLAPLAPANEFGFRNSVLVVGEPPS